MRRRMSSAYLAARRCRGRKWCRRSSLRIPRLGFLTFGSGYVAGDLFAFFEGLRDLGYVDGKSINIDYLPQRAMASGFQRSLPNVWTAKQ